MGFLTGRVSYERFEVGGAALREFGPSHVEKLKKHAIGARGALAADGVEIGFTAGDHVLDLDFSYAKNVVHDTLCCAMRVDANKVPADLKRAYYQMELAEIAKD